MSENTSCFNVFPVFFRGKTGGFGGRGAEGAFIGEAKASGQGNSGRYLPAEIGGGNRGEGRQGIF